MTGDIANIFLPYFLLLFFVLLGCMCYKLAIPFSFHRIFGRSSPNTRPDGSREFRHHRFLPRITRNQRSGGAGDVTSSLPLPLADDNSIRLVESLLHENLNRASMCEREARRLATILANTRGISTDEYLESTRRQQDETTTSSTTAVGMHFMPTQFYDDFELIADLPPAYDECVTTTTGNSISIPMEVEEGNVDSQKIVAGVPTNTENEPNPKTP